MKFNLAHILVIGAASMILIPSSGSAQAYDGEFDYNGDGAVDAADSALITAAFNTGEGDNEFDPIFDHDGDGYISMADVSLALAAAGEQ
jgi:hypothetical protein